MDETPLARLRFSLAEATVFGEQGFLLEQALGKFIEAVHADDGPMTAKWWEEMGDHMNMIGSLLNAKGAIAMRAYAHDHPGASE